MPTTSPTAERVRLPRAVESPPTHSEPALPIQRTRKSLTVTLDADLYVWLQETAATADYPLNSVSALVELALREMRKRGASVALPPAKGNAE